MVQLLDLVDIDTLERLQLKFTELLGFNIAFANPDSVIIGDGNRPTGDVDSICTLMMKKDEGRIRCRSSDEEAGKLAIEMGKPILYRCQCYFSNFVIPIKISDEVIGFLYGGQFFARPPGEKTNREWEAEKILRGVSQEEWPDVKKKIQKDEEDEWEKLKVSTGAIINTNNKDYIHAHFFHMAEGIPTDDDLIHIASSGGHWSEVQKEGFVNNFRDQSNPDKIPNKRLKDPRHIFYAINILSEIAHVLSDECNTKYALKTYVEISEECKKINFHKKILKNETDKLSHLIDQHLKSLRNMEDESHKKQSIDEIDLTSIKIYTLIMDWEFKQISWQIWINKYIYGHVVLNKKKEIFKPVTQLTKGIVNLTDRTKPNYREQKELLIRKISDIRKEREQIVESRNIIFPIIGWGSFSVAIIGLIFGFLV